MVFTTTKTLFNRNKQFVCLAMRQSLRNLFDLVQKHNELKRDEYEANQRQIVSVGTGTNNRVIVPGYMEMNNPKYSVMNYNEYKNCLLFMWASFIKIMLSCVKKIFV
jgi:hypothetical protein